MESHGDSEGFKHIPVRLYSDDGICNQRLVSPKNSDGTRKVLQQMISELYPDKSEGKSQFSHFLLLLFKRPSLILKMVNHCSNVQMPGWEEIMLTSNGSVDQFY